MPNKLNAAEKNCDNNFGTSFYRQITYLNRLRRKFMAKKLKDYGLKGSMYMFMSSLERNPGANQDFLVARFIMDKGNVARTAKKLEDLEYIVREIDPQDRRQYKLYLTEKGMQLVPIIREYLTEWGDALCENFSEEEKSLATAYLERMIENSMKNIES